MFRAARHSMNQPSHERNFGFFEARARRGIAPAAFQRVAGGCGSSVTGRDSPRRKASPAVRANQQPDDVNFWFSALGPACSTTATCTTSGS